MSDTLKKVFLDYADKNGVSLRSLRFTHNGSVLFLSSTGSKTAEQAGIKHKDVIHISSTVSQPQAELPKKSGQQTPSPPKAKKTGKGKRGRKSSPTAVVIPEGIEQFKLRHSKRLSAVFEEAQPLLKSIRQRLNSLAIDRTLPKRKCPSGKRHTMVPESVGPILPTDGIGGKAGKTQFLVQVGEACNLYKTTKKSACSLQQKPIVTDLHGLTKEEAVSLLAASLPSWIDLAMSGSYPFVVPVRIVCGGGSQVLSEAVETWIRQNDCVANAPKALYA